MKRRAHASEAERTQHVTAYRRSGLSVAAYCQRHGVSTSTLYSWLTKRAPRGAQAPSFVAIAPMRAATPVSPTLVRVMLGDVSIEFAPETPMAVVAGLITELTRGAEHPGT
jgi:transposase-like protein